jgi:hypothetical protein
MKTKAIFFILITIVLMLNACSPAPSANPTEEVPAPVTNGKGYEALQIDEVRVEVGVGSPIPVHVNVSGSLPDTCAQLEYSEIKLDGSNFIIQLSTLPGSGDDCIKDALPFRMSIPLNIIGLPVGDYSVDVNGARANFKLDSGDSNASLRTADMPITKADIQVDSVNIEVGVGSPIPVKAIVSLNLPNSCAQLGEIRLHRDGSTLFVRLIADVPQEDNCREDSIPFRLEIPLNIVNLPEGPYDVNVNGATASFDPRTVPASP